MSKKNAQQNAEAASSRRELLRLQQEEAAKRARTTRIVGVIAGVVAIAIIAMVGVLVLQQVREKDAQAAVDKAAQTTIPSLNSGKDGIVVNPAKADPATVPTLVVYQDFQCPVCKQYEEIYGAALTSLVDSGKLILDYRTMTFMDTNLQNTASVRSTVGAACADVAGLYTDYHEAVFANQAAEERVGDVGYTDELLRDDIPGDLGMTGDTLTSFQACYDKKSTHDVISSINEAAGRAGVNSTPTYRVNGADFELRSVNPTADELLAAIRTAAGMTP